MDSKLPAVFVSYSHKDERWKNRVLRHLQVLEKESVLYLWDDRRIQPGADWYREVTKALDSARVAVLLISPNSLTSDFILREEVSRLLQRRDAEGLKVFPLILEPCPWKAVKWLASMQLRPRDAQPLLSLRRPQAEQVLADIAGEIAEALASSVQCDAPPPGAFPTRLSPHSHIVALIGSSPSTGPRIINVRASYSPELPKHYWQEPELVTQYATKIIQGMAVRWHGTLKDFCERSGPTDQIAAVTVSVDAEFPVPQASVVAACVVARLSCFLEVLLRRRVAEDLADAVDSYRSKSTAAQHTVSEPGTESRLQWVEMGSEEQEAHEAIECKYLFRRLVRLLHPDVTPGTNESQWFVSLLHHRKDLLYLRAMRGALDPFELARMDLNPSDALCAWLDHLAQLQQEKDQFRRHLTILKDELEMYGDLATNSSVPEDREMGISVKIREQRLNQLWCQIRWRLGENVVG